MSKINDNSVRESPFAIKDNEHSHTVSFKTNHENFLSKAEKSGQLVVCVSGEIRLYGHDGEWVIPAGYMVYIPKDRMFQIKSKIPTTGLVTKFCKKEVAWHHDGCWVGPVNEIAVHLTNYSLKWSSVELRRCRKAKSFFVTLGEMLPGWYQHERIMWTPYAENSAIQKVVDYIQQQGTGVSLPVVAKHIGMSGRTLRRHLQAELGQSWREFIREQRMNKAMEILSKQQKSITETAFDVGFSSSSAFSSAFLQYVGKTPSAFAKTARQRAVAV